MKKPRFDPYSASNQKIVDTLIAGSAFCLAYEIRFDTQMPPSASFQMWAVLPAFVLAHLLLNIVLGTYRMIWRYVSLRDAVILTRNYAIVPSIMLALRYGAPAVWPTVRVPLSIAIIAYLLALIGALSARALRRLLYEGASRRALHGKKAIPVLLIGAGRIGVKTADEVRAQVNLRPVGFLDDDVCKADSVLGGLRVLGPIKSLSSVILEYEVRQVILCIARPPRELLRRVWATCELHGLPIKMVPSLQEILDGRISIASFRNVEMQDLLGRDPVAGSGDMAEISSIYGHRRILVTGAGGSIGSELVMQLAHLQPSHLILLDKDENGLNDAYVRLQGSSSVKATPVVADLRFPERLREIFDSYGPEIVFHAAAHKHVHLMEINPCEAIANNVSGTRNLVEQSVISGVSRFIQISTDKAVNPTSIMGASKRVCEMIVQSQGERPHTLFCCVRFGNVLGSRGSVVPIFQDQILRGGPVTVTNPDAQRFLMTIPEAVCLLIQAGMLAHRGEIFVLDMGEPVCIGKLAEDLIELSGLSPNRDVRIEITGMKLGEKVAEILIDDSCEKLRPTRLSKIQTIANHHFDVAEFTNRVRSLERAAWHGDAEEVHRILAAFDIGFVYSATLLPWPRTRRAPVATAASANAGAPFQA